MNLKDLVNSLDIVKVVGDLDKNIDDIVYNSKNAKKDTVFVALVGMTMDGHKYIYDAFKKGARAFIISDMSYITQDEEAVYIVVKDTRDTLAYISDIFFDFPSKKMTVIGITGTKGKTTVSNYIKTVLDNSDIPCGVIGTNGIFYMDKKIKSLNTTPESYEIQKNLKDMLDCGVKAVAMEVSSSGLMMERVNYIDFDYAIFTNITPDHIGEKEHPTFEHYLKCKAKLFPMSKFSIINGDDEKSKFIEDCANKYITFGLKENDNLRAEEIKYPTDLNNIRTSFTVNGKKYFVNSFGEFGVYNALCTIAVCEKMNLSYEKIKEGLEKAHVKGRLQVLHQIKDRVVVIDYAHNEVSLENILKTVKDLNPKRIITLFGSIGTRAKHRRIELAQVSSKYSDIIVVTSDNPDTEDPKSIVDEIVSNISDEKKKDTYAIVDRSEAIKKAMEISKDGDIIIITGKGHEEYQIINGIREHFSDEEQALKWAKYYNLLK